LAGDAIAEVDTRGQKIVDDTLLMLLNAHYEPLPFILPAHKRGLRWELVLDTRDPLPPVKKCLVRGGRPYELEARSLALFRLQREEEVERVTKMRKKAKVLVAGPDHHEQESVV
jgi:glycogen operon protein